MAHQSVLITAEGTYPHYGGGVSVWCDQLVTHLPDVEFDVLSIVHSPGQPRRFQLPGNVRSLHTAPLWGTPRPGLFDTGAAKSFRRRARTTDSVVRREFLPIFETILEEILQPGFSPAVLGLALAELAEYSRRFDYAASMSSRGAWQAHLRLCRKHERKMTLEDATNCLRWLQRYLAVVTIDLPRVDLVHGTMSGLAGLPGVISKLQHGTPYILTEHGLHLREMYSTLARGEFTAASRAFLARFHSALVRLSYHHADRITALGPFNQRWQIALGADPAKIRTAPNGVDPEVFHPRRTAPRSRPTVLTMARIFELKGIRPLVEAAAIVRDRVPDVLFRVLGEVADEGYFRSCKKAIAEARLEDNIEFGVTHENYLAYAEADVYCSPSLSEGMPYAVLEAMMSGCPVVATEVGNVKDIIGGAGLLVHPNNPGELASALLELLDGPGAADFRGFLSDAALKRARQHFTLERCTANFKQLYDEVLLAETVTAIPEAR